MTAPRTRTRLADRLDGLLFFPVTAFGPDGTVDLDVHLDPRRRVQPQENFCMTPL